MSDLDEKALEAAQKAYWSLACNPRARLMLAISAYLSTMKANGYTMTRLVTRERPPFVFDDDPP